MINDLMSHLKCLLGLFRKSFRDETLEGALRDHGRRHPGLVVPLEDRQIQVCVTLFLSTITLGLSGLDATEVEMH